MKQYENWNRLEYEIYSPYANQCSDEELFSGFAHILFASEKINDRKIIWQPKSDYKPENSLKSFIKYSKNHWINPWIALNDLVNEFFRSSEIDKVTKLEVFADSLENQRLQYLYRELQEPMSLEDDQKVEAFLKTDKWQWVLEFFQAFIKNRQ